MASQVLSGSSVVSYTNNTGQNVRIVINYMAANSPTIPNIQISWSGATVITRGLLAIGRNLAYYNSDTSTSNSSSSTANNALGGPEGLAEALPTEIMLAPGQTFFANCGAHNIVIIPEAG